MGWMCLRVRDWGVQGFRTTVDLLFDGQGFGLHLSFKLATLNPDKGST